MKEACKEIGRKLKNTRCMNTNEFFAYSLLFVSILSIVVGLIINLLAIFAE
jgi:hypothetical protein